MNCEDWLKQEILTLLKESEGFREFCKDLGDEDTLANQVGLGPPDFIIPYIRSLEKKIRNLEEIAKVAQSVADGF